MQVVSLFTDTLFLSDTDKNRLDRISRAGGQLLKLTKSGARLNPVTIWVEAAISVCDAFGAWARYEQAKQITRQLEVKCNELRHICANTLSQFDLELQELHLHRVQTLKILTERIQQDHQSQIELLAKISGQREAIEQLRVIVINLRTTTNCSPRAILDDLEATIEGLVRAQIQTLLYSLDNPT